MKKTLICLLMTLAMVLSLVSVMVIGVNADSSDLQVCTDCIEINGEGHESTSALTADAWFEQEYGGVITDEDGTVETFHVRGWANPLDGSDLIQYGYSIDGAIVWNDDFLAPEAGLHGYFAKAERFDVTVYLGSLAPGDYEFHLYARTTSGIYEVKEESFVFEKKAGGEYENVALGKSVNADRSMEVSFFGAQMLTDGKVVPFDGVTLTDPLGWTAGTGDPFFMQRDQEIWVYIDLAGNYEISCVKVFPQLFLDGAGMPSSYTILAGPDTAGLAPVASVQGCNESDADKTTDPTVLTFAPVMAKLVAFRVDRASWLTEADGSYLSEVGEIEVYGKEAPITDPETEPVTDPVTDPETDPVTDPVTDPETDPATDPVTDPATDPATAADTDPAATEEDTDAGEDTGCASVMSAAALVVLLCGAAFVCKRKD